MKNLRAKYSASFKAKVVLVALKVQKTSAELAGHYQVHSTQMRPWESMVTQGLIDIFTDRRQKREQDKGRVIEELYQTDRRLKAESCRSR